MRGVLVVAGSGRTTLVLSDPTTKTKTKTKTDATKTKTKTPAYIPQTDAKEYCAAQEGLGRDAEILSRCGAVVYLLTRPDLLRDTLQGKRKDEWLQFGDAVKARAGDDKAERFATDTRKFALLVLNSNPTDLKTDGDNLNGDASRKLHRNAVALLATLTKPTDDNPSPTYADAVGRLRDKFIKGYSNPHQLRVAYAERYGKAHRAGGSGTKTKTDQTDATKTDQTDATKTGPVPGLEVSFKVELKNILGRLETLRDRGADEGDVIRKDVIQAATLLIGLADEVAARRIAGLAATRADQLSPVVEPVGTVTKTKTDQTNPVPVPVPATKTKTRRKVAA